MHLSDLPDDDDWCDWCGGELPWDSCYGRRRFCGLTCKRKAETARRRQRRHAARYGRTCAFCGGPIPFDRQPPAIYCCTECGQADHAETKYEAAKAERRQAKAGRHCQECGGKIPSERRADARYCSERCKWTVTNRRARARKQFAT